MGHGRRPNPRLIKSHMTYTVDEAADTLDSHKNTVRLWLKQGLSTIDGKRPTLIYGADLIRFLTERRAKAKRPCGPNQIYCVRCRLAQIPAGNMADFTQLTATAGNLIGICPTCESLMYRRVALTNLDRVRAVLDITATDAISRIRERPSLSVNCDSTDEARE
jgi:hypothetical protein